MMRISAVLSLASLALIQYVSAQTAPSQTMLRFPCSQLVVDRVDPLVEPGRKYSAHLHQIVGGNSFNLTMEAGKFDMPGRSTCTSCSYAEDLSNYWTAIIFYRSKSGKVKRVPQIGNGGPQGRLNQKGGITMYYIPNGRVTAFKPGFRMVAGDAAQTDASRVSKSNICHRCWNADSEDTFVGGAPCSGSDTVEIPQDRSCKYIRQTIIFPACWDGTSLDSPDHQSHMAYGNGFQLNCPSSHPVKVPQLMYEIMWDMREFLDTSDWPSDGKPFVLSMDLGGSAAHADYMFGWKGDSLQRAMDNNCNLNQNCPAGGISVQSPDAYNNCHVEQMSPEAVDGWLPALPLGDPMQNSQVGGSPSGSGSGSGSGSCVASMNQCGGSLYSGPTNCCSGMTCTFRTQYYSQCR